jgi:hypothetical protein
MLGSLRTRPLRILCAAAVLLLVGGPVFGVVIASESFEYDISSDAGLAGKGSAGGGWGDAWNTNSSTIVDVSADPLFANGYGGGNQACQIAYGNENGRRPFASTLQPDESELWLSYLLRWEAGSDGDGERTWVFNTISNWDHRILGVKSQADGGDFVAGSGYGNNTSGGPEFTVGETVMVVGRITGTQLDLWVNPTAPSDTPDVTHPGGWSDWPGVGLSNRQNDDTFLVDRILVGESYQDVVPEPATLTLLALGAAAVLRRRRKA